MPTVTFLLPDGSTAVAEVATGTSLMRAALLNDISGIVGECGGQAMCATCHVYVGDDVAASLYPLSEDEAEMLDCTAEPRDLARSRLGCQIAVDADITVALPKSQV